MGSTKRERTVTDRKWIPYKNIKSIEKILICYLFWMNRSRLGINLAGRELKLLQNANMSQDINHLIFFIFSHIRVIIMCHRDFGP